MPDPHVISALVDKAHELRSAIVSYEEHLERTRRELAVVAATITLFERDGHRLTDQRPAHGPELLKAEPDLPVPVPLEELVARLDIQSIEPLKTAGFEGGLITDDAKSSGIICTRRAAR